MTTTLEESLQILETLCLVRIGKKSYVCGEKVASDQEDPLDTSCNMTEWVPVPRMQNHHNKAENSETSEDDYNIKFWFILLL